MTESLIVSRLLAALPVLALMPPPATLGDYSPLYGIHTDYELAAQYASIDEFVQVVSGKGYAAIMYMIAEAHPDPVNGYADYRFASPTLSSLGWTFVRDDLSELMAAASNHNIDVIVDLQALAYVALWPESYPLVVPPAVDDIVNVAYELTAYGVQGISEEMFLADWFAPLAQACQGTGIVYTHKAIDWDFGAMAHYWNSTVFQIYPNCGVIMTEDYYMMADPPMMVANEQFPSIAGWLDREYQVKVCADDWALRTLPNMENVMLLKALQFKPTYIYMMTWSPYQVDWFDLGHMTDLIQEHVSQETKPLCNVVLYLTGDEPPDVWDWWEVPSTLAPISNGIKASGYDIVTSPVPIDEADIYYVYTRGEYEWGTTLDLSDSIVQLFDSGKPVFLQLTQILPNTTPSWDIVRGKLGIDCTTFETIHNGENMLYGSYNGIEYPHLRKDPDSHFNNITAENMAPSGEVVATGSHQGTVYALITRNGNNYFVNGTHLDLRASFPISNLISDGLQKPTACVATAGRTSLFYALDMSDGQRDSTELQVKLPDPQIREVNWFKRDFYGIVTAGVAPYYPSVGWVDTLCEGTLLILKPSATGTDFPSYATHPTGPTLHLLQNHPNPFRRTTTITYTVQGSRAPNRMVQGRGAEEQRGRGDAATRGHGETSRIPNSISHISLSIYDLSARLVRTLLHKPYNHPTLELSDRVVWDGRDDNGREVSSGLYFAVLSLDRAQQMRKLLLLR